MEDQNSEETGIVDEVCDLFFYNVLGHKGNYLFGFIRKFNQKWLIRKKWMSKIALKNKQLKSPFTN